MPSNPEHGFTYPLPRDTQAILQKKGRPERVCTHMGLLLDRYVPLEAIKKDDHLNEHEKKDGQWNVFWLQDVSRAIRRAQHEKLITAMYARWQATTRGASTFTMRAQGRIIVGLGNKGPLEFGITLHHTTGLPIIPGSALKGLCRTYALLRIAEELGIAPSAKPQEKKAGVLACLDAALAVPDGDERKRALATLEQALRREDQRVAVTEERLQASREARLFRACFGSQAESGACIFHEAVLVPDSVRASEPLFDLDVMTPHFKNYYDDHGKGGAAPHDGDKPTPIVFLTVRSGTRFAFAVGQRRLATEPEVVGQAQRWLMEGLR